MSATLTRANRALIVSNYLRNYFNFLSERFYVLDDVFVIMPIFQTYSHDQSLLLNIMQIFICVNSSSMKNLRVTLHIFFAAAHTSLIKMGDVMLCARDKNYIYIPMLLIFSRSLDRGPSLPRRASSTADDRSQ